MSTNAYNGRATTLLWSLLVMEPNVVATASALGAGWADLMEAQALLLDTLHPVERPALYDAVTHRIQDVLHAVWARRRQRAVVLGPTLA